MYTVSYINGCTTQYSIHSGVDLDNHRFNDGTNTVYMFCHEEFRGDAVSMWSRTFLYAAIIVVNQ